MNLLKTCQVDFGAGEPSVGTGSSVVLSARVELLPAPVTESADQHLLCPLGSWPVQAVSCLLKPALRGVPETPGPRPNSHLSDANSCSPRLG